MSDDLLPKTDAILWSCVARNDVILAEAAGLDRNFNVIETAKEVLKRKSTPGFEFHTQKGLVSGGGERLKAMKFHLYEHGEGENLIMWVFAAVYNGSRLTKAQVQSFLEKIVTITEVFRETAEWRYGCQLSAQASFAPILLQRMEEVTYLGKYALLEERLETTKDIMHNNIELILEREEKLYELNEDATRLQEMASVFKKKAKKLRRMKMMQDAKHGLMIGAAITAGVAIIVVPPLVVAL